VASRTGFSIAQVRQAINTTAQPRSGRLPAFFHKEDFLQLLVTLFKGAYREYTIWSTLRRLGYRRYVACRKPIILEETRQARLA
ncbi:hypothetical protein LZ31DRAFT_560880, partial [Colletotrichum somersetense]